MIKFKFMKIWALRFCAMNHLADSLYKSQYFKSNKYTKYKKI